MIIYFVAFFITLFMCYMANKATDLKQKKIFMFVSVLPFLIVSSIRYNVGIDTWLNYTPTFESVALYGERFEVIPFLREKYEIGFSLIVMILARICSNPVILFVFCSTIIMAFTFGAIYKQSSITWLSIVLFFLSGAFLLSMNGMRNYMALAIAIYALKYIYEKKPVKFIVMILIAALIHKSMLIILIFYPLYNVKVNRKCIGIILAISLVLTFFIDQIVKMLVSFTAYNNYFITDKQLVDPLYTMLIVNVIIGAFFLFNYKKNKDDSKYNFYLKLQVMSIIICMFSFKLTLAYRIEQIIDFFQIITIPYNIYLLKNDPESSKKIIIYIITAIILIYSIYFTKVFIFSDDNQVRNYTTIFNKDKSLKRR